MHPTHLLRLRAAPLLAKAGRTSAAAPSWARAAPAAPASSPASSSTASTSTSTSTATPTASTSASSAGEGEGEGEGGASTIGGKDKPDPTLFAANGMPLPEGARLAPPQRPLGPRTDRKKSVMDSFRTLPPGQRAGIGIIMGIFAFALMWVDRTIAPEVAEDKAEEGEGEKPRGMFGVRVVARDR